MSYRMDSEGIHEAEKINMQQAMRCLARAGALADERWDDSRFLDKGCVGRELDAAHLSGAMWMQARAICNELGHDWEFISTQARRYAQQVVHGNINVTN